MNASSKSSRLCVLVLGMHRSGTSAMTRCLNLLGMDLGSHLLSPENMNAKGFWEHADAVRINDQLLHSMKTFWHSLEPLPQDWLKSSAAQEARANIKALIKRDFSDVPLWGIKDPRLCRLAPLWLDVLHELDIPVATVFVTRSPIEVAASLERVHHFSRSFGVVSWMQHLAEAEVATRDTPRYMVAYDQLLRDPVSTLTRLGDALGIHWSVPIIERKDALSSFLDDGLRTQKQDTANESLPSLPRRMVETVDQIISSGNSSESWKKLSNLADEVVDFSELLGSLEQVEKSGGSPKSKSSARLYYAQEGQPFDETRQSRMELTEGGRCQLDFPLLNYSHSETFSTRYRLDPVDSAAHCVIHSLVLLDDDSQVIWNFSQGKHFSLIGFTKYEADLIEKRFVRTDSDPQVLFTWPEDILRRGRVLRLDIELLSTLDIVDELIAKNSSLSEQLAESNSQCKKLVDANDDASGQLATMAMELKRVEYENVVKDLTRARERLELTTHFQNDIQRSEERSSADLQKTRVEHAKSLQEIESLTTALQQQKLQIEELQRSIGFRILRRLRIRK
ncbi:hypothetical protein EKH79_09615 [Dyella dinghuensis]|uniref:Sulfotransferase family protein n=1 Tax=Dyella dinghuensis TaxID=1920169 RepID=A0A3S0RTL0_9GAMM|nr:hypothetical protein [Dyella dinghuensis]RUL64291.1 hypothetical protein EKH79_09615 [Dyella dinghuensis]